MFMKIFSAAIFSAACLCAFGTEYRAAKISNGVIEADVCTDTGLNGYYRGVRFDPSGIIFSLKAGGHVYFGSRHDIHRPDWHDCITGPVEEYLVVGYDEADAGGTFLKIGVGMLEKLSDAPYNFRLPYKLTNGGERSVKVFPDSVEYVHKLDDTSGYAYVLVKTLVLEKNSNRLAIRHRLKNTGSKKIESNVYNHNFFVIDNAVVDESVSVRFGFDLNCDKSGLGEIAKIEGNSIRFLRRMCGDERVSIDNIPCPQGSKNVMCVENAKVGAGVRVAGDAPIMKAVFWSDKKSVCPEPFVKISVGPGEEFEWNLHYDFYSLK